MPTRRTRTTCASTSRRRRAAAEQAREKTGGDGKGDSDSASAPSSEPAVDVSDVTDGVAALAVADESSKKKQAANTLEGEHDV